MTLAGLAAGLVFVVALAGAAVPMIRGRRLQLDPLGAPADDAAITALRALRDLDRDRERGAVDADAYSALRPRLELEAAAALEAGAAVEPPADGRPEPAPRGPRRRPGRVRTRAPRHPAPARPRRLKVLVPVLLAGAVLAIAAAGFGSGTVAPRGQGDFATGGTGTIKDTPTERLEQAATASPNDVDAHLALGQRYLELKRPGDATRQYLTVLRLDPENPEAGTRIALVVYESGDSERALEGVDHVLATHPTHPEALFLKGVILLNGLDRPADAVAPLQAYLAIDPNGGYANDARELLQEARSKS